LTHSQRKAYFRQLERTYLPHRQYQDSPYLESGGFWEKQMHIFQCPLYYLDYTIAQVVALEFFTEANRDHKKAFEKYLAFDRLGGTLPFRALLNKAAIDNPMDGDTLKRVSEEIMNYLSTFDLSKLDR